MIQSMDIRPRRDFTGNSCCKILDFSLPLSLHLCGLLEMISLFWIAWDGTEKNELIAMF
jgi:hypothetical protein